MCCVNTARSRSPQRDADPLGTPISRLAPSRSAAYVAAAARASHSLALSSRTVKRASRRVRDLLLPGSCRNRRMIAVSEFRSAPRSVSPLTGMYP